MPSTKTIIGCAASCLAVAALAAQAPALPDPTVEWTVETPGISGSPVAYPAENPDSVVSSSGGRAVRISGAGEVIFAVEFGPEASRGGVMEPSVADLDGDGVDEIITGHNDGLIVALRGADGRVLWEYDLGTSLDVWRMPITADLDGDGAAEVIAANMDGWIACLNGDGSLRWRSKIEEYRLSTPAVGDINNDGRPEIVYGTATRHVIALDADGRLLWDRFHPPLHMGRTKPVIADLDGDGAAEVYTMSSMIGEGIGLLCLNGADGAVKWEGATWHKAYHGLSVARLADGSLGVLACDKGGNLGAYGADGVLRWRTQVLGQGIWTPPVQADVDGDGRLEILFTQRNTSLDGEGHSWYVLDDGGAVIGAYGGGNGFHSPLVADIDGDGVLEVVIAFGEGRIVCHSFGGAAKEGAVVAADWRGPAYRARAGAQDRKTETYGEALELATLKSDPHLGLNPIEVTIPDGIAANAVEISAQPADGPVWRRVYRAEHGEKAIQGRWPVVSKGPQTLTLTLLDTRTGAALGSQEIAINLERPEEPISVARAEAMKVLEPGNGETITASQMGTLAMLSGQREKLRYEFDHLRLKTLGLNRKSAGVQDEAFREIDAYLQEVDNSVRLASLVRKVWSSGRGASLIMWQDDNPWDNIPPKNALPDSGGPLTARTWAFGREIESVAINALNLTSKGMTLRFEPGQIYRAGEEQALGPAGDVATLMRAVWLPSRFGEVVPDMLPELGAGSLLDIAPGEVSQLWINLNTHDLEPGSYELRWPVHTLDQPPAEQTLTVALEVSSVRLPEKSRFLTGYWSKNRIGDFSTVANLNEHLQTLWYQLPLPAAEADASGNLSGALDWSAHDAILSEARQVDMILYSGPPVPRFPEGVEVTTELRRAGQRAYFQAMVDHLAEFGLGPEHFCFYVEDEPGLRGTIEHYMERARENREIDPRIQNYANPWGGITIENIREMAPVTDVWQPGMETIEFLGPEYVEAMRAPGERIAMYTPPGNCRVLRPLGFYRAQPWQAFHWGIEGGGWWVYYQGDDLFATDPNKEPAYAAVHFDGRALVNSRRWEAQRDGIEDFNAITMLSELAEVRNDAAAKAVLKEAVDYVAGETITGMPREAADYDMDFARFSELRSKIRLELERLWP
ncbi:MAG: PQQ-like beta-propeller repeat protein [Candidatus Hydrogenedentes bacterium]|nr:PQQ-like beta-propeller repeat protein [Candidatus Hydrogenedentota bacterium]